jgi:uncharacterized protein
MSMRLEVGPQILPELDSDNAPYWEAAARSELSLCRCRKCSQIIHPPGPGCWVCGGADVEWINLGSKITGTIYTYICIYRSFLPSHAKTVPFVVALCALDTVPGARIMANLLDSVDGEVSIGMPVEMVWEQRGEGFMMPQWRPRQTTDGEGE